MLQDIATKLKENEPALIEGRENLEEALDRLESIAKVLDTVSRFLDVIGEGGLPGFTRTLLHDADLDHQRQRWLEAWPTHARMAPRGRYASRRVRNCKFPI